MAGSRYGWPGEGWIQVWLARGRLDPGMAGPNPPWLGGSIFKKFTKIVILAFFGSKMVKKS